MRVYYTEKANQVVSRVLRRLAPGQKIITRRSQEELCSLATLYPHDTRSFLKALLALERVAVPITKIIVPEGIRKAGNLALQDLRRPGFLLSIIDEQGKLDLRRAGIKKKIGYRDLTSEFKDYQAVEELKRGLADEEYLSLMREDRELRDLYLFQVLWQVRALLYGAEEIKAAGIKEKDEVSICESRTLITKLADYLEGLQQVFPFKGMFSEVPEEFPYGELAPARRISKTVELLRKGNTPAADAVLASFTERLEKEIDLLEKERIRRQWRSRKRRPKNPMEESLLHLAQRRYRITFSPEGFWIMPQGGFRTQGLVKRKEIIAHQVPVDKVLRREEHKIEEISRKITINAEFAALLESIGKLLVSSENPETEQVEKCIASAYLAYEKGIVRPKIKVRLLLKLSLDLILTIRSLREEAGKKRLWKFVGQVCNLASSELLRLNENLGEQLGRISAKQKLVLEIIAANLLRDGELRSLANALIFSLPSNEIMQKSEAAWALRERGARLLKQLEITKDTEPGIVRAKQRLSRIINLLAAIARKNREKEGLRNKIRELRVQYKIQKWFLKKKSPETIKPLMNYAREAAQKVFEELSKRNSKIQQELFEIAREALLILWDLENKYVNEVEESSLTSYLEKHRDIFSLLEKLNANYQMVVDKEGQPIALAHPYDIKILELKVLKQS